MGVGLHNFPANFYTVKTMIFWIAILFDGGKNRTQKKGLRFLSIFIFLVNQVSRNFEKMVKN